MASRKYFKKIIARVDHICLYTQYHKCQRRMQGHLGVRFRAVQSARIVDVAQERDQADQCSDAGKPLSYLTARAARCQEQCQAEEQEFEGSAECHAGRISRSRGGALQEYRADIQTPTRQILEEGQ